MPYKLVKKGDKYEVINSKTGKSHGVHATKEKAQKQMRLLYGIESGWEPTK